VLIANGFFFADAVESSHALERVQPDLPGGLDAGGMGRSDWVPPISQSDLSWKGCNLRLLGHLSHVSVSAGDRVQVKVARY
jgi:hypothetical protein